jgi:hypothetical protein
MNSHHTVRDFNHRPQTASFAHLVGATQFRDIYFVGHGIAVCKKECAVMVPYDAKDSQLSPELKLDSGSPLRRETNC